MTEDLIMSFMAVFRTLTRGFIASGNVDRARELIAAMREACDELTAEVNAARRTAPKDAA
ncbi:MAG TPA: hypothetical protein VGG61_14965 [Gemmataceae bacterium]|jgi:hypothetical protein